MDNIPISKQFLAKFEHALASKGDFLKTNDKFPSDSSSEEEKVNFVTKSLQLYKTFGFYADEDILDKLKEMGFQRDLLRWFISIQDCNEVIEKINSSEDFSANPFEVLFFMEFYAQYCFLADLQGNLKLVLTARNETNYNVTAKTAFDYFRRIEDRISKGKEAPIQSFDKLCDDLFTPFANYLQALDLGSEAIDQHSLIKVFRGKGAAYTLGHIPGLFDNRRKTSKNKLYEFLLEVLKPVLCKIHIEEPIINKDFTKAQIKSAVRAARDKNIRKLKKFLSHNRRRKA
jgi:hypothetical protein